MRSEVTIFAECLRKLRLSAYLSQAGLSELSGIPLGTIKGWETSRQYPTPEHFGRLVEFFGDTDVSVKLLEQFKEIYLQCKKK